MLPTPRRISPTLMSLGSRVAVPATGEELPTGGTFDFARCFPAWIAGFRQFQRTIRAEEAVAASALGRMPVRCPAVCGSLWM
jgi:hypothetical protein